MPGNARSYLVKILVLVSWAFSPKSHFILNAEYKLISKVDFFKVIESYVDLFTSENSPNALFLLVKYLK